MANPFKDSIGKRPDASTENSQNPPEGTRNDWKPPGDVTKSEIDRPNMESLDGKEVSRSSGIKKGNGKRGINKGCDGSSELDKKKIIQELVLGDRR